MFFFKYIFLTFSDVIIEASAFCQRNSKAEQN